MFRWWGIILRVNESFDSNDSESRKDSLAVHTLVNVANQLALAVRDVTRQLAHVTKAVRAPRSSSPDASEKTQTRPFLALKLIL